MTKTSQTVSVTHPSAMTELCHLIQPGQPLVFEDGYTHFVMPGALSGIEKITIEGLHDARIWFLDQIRGYAVYQDSYRPDSGVLNLVDCQGLTLNNLVAENKRSYLAGNLITESSSVVNISGGDGIVLRGCDLTSNGKLCVTVHSGARVLLDQCTLRGHYFEVMNAASDLVVTKCAFKQEHDEPDSHSAILVVSSMREAVYNLLHENGNTLVEDCDFRMYSGRSLVSGNGSYTTRSNVKLVRCTAQIDDETFGVFPWHENFNSVTVEYGESPDLAEEVQGNYVSTPDAGFARFVNYYGEPAESHRPGGPESISPVLVDGVSSKDVSW